MLHLLFCDVGSTSVLQRPQFYDAISSFISGAGSLLGGLASSSGSHYAARKQLQAVRETNQMNYQIAQDNNAFNERMWNMQNEYNSPVNQRYRLEAAGLNPYLMMNGGSAGVAETAPTADTSGTQIAPDIGTTIAGGYQALGNSISSAASQIAQMSFQNDLQQANVAKTQAEATNVALESEYNKLRNQFAAAQFLTDLRLKQKQGDISEYEANYLRDSMQDRLDSVKFQNTLSGSQSSYYNQLAGLTEMQHKIADTNLKWLDREKQVAILVAMQNARTAASQMRLNYASAKNMIAMAGLNAANAAGVRIDNRLKDDIYDLSVGKAENEYENGLWTNEKSRMGFDIPVTHLPSGFVKGLGNAASGDFNGYGSGHPIRRHAKKR
jgi:hypothetical protein